MRSPSSPALVDSGWWRRAVVYQVYLRSFTDGNGDGIGDLAGLRARLGHLQDLGVDAIWITPWYPSPMADGGYDVADYRDVDPRFGSLADAEALVADAHAIGLRVLIDIVPNHTSVEHRWFREAVASPPGSPARARYHFRDGRGRDGDEPPNDWPSVFGGPAWTRLAGPDGRPGQWYLHLFDASQPDLDWSNPEVRAEFESILGFWLDRGVDGFRIDVAHFLVKAPGLPDLGTVPAAGPLAAREPFADREELHDIYRGWRRVLDARRRDAVFCGEIQLEAPRIARYLGPDELHTAFNFDFALRPWDAGELRESIDVTLATHAVVGAPATWVIGNHDLPRPVYRYGRDPGGWDVAAWSRRPASDQRAGLARARAAALLSLALPGSAYVYQGDELGLPEVLNLPDAVREDPTFRRTGGAEPGRDGCRVPIPWSGSAAPYGFGPDGSTPWLPQPPGWGSWSVAAEDQDPASVLSLYRAALAIRRGHPGLAGASFRWRPAAGGVLRFARDDAFECVVNLSAEPVALPADARLLLASVPLVDARLPADGAAWLEVGG